MVYLYILMHCIIFNHHSCAQNKIGVVLCNHYRYTSQYLNNLNLKGPYPLGDIGKIDAIIGADLAPIITPIILWVWSIDWATGWPLSGHWDRPENG